MINSLFLASNQIKGIQGLSSLVFLEILELGANRIEVLYQSQD